MRTLTLVTIVLTLLAAPATVAIVSTARAYVQTTHDIAGIRFEVLAITPETESSRALAGPRVTLRIHGVGVTTLTLAEVNFDLLWQGTRMATAATYPNLPVPRDAVTDFTLSTNLDPGKVTEMHDLMARGEQGFLLVGNARVRLAGGTEGVWLTLRGQKRAS